MEGNELVSIVILTYNNFKYIFETLDSVFMQTYQNIEIVINDDASKYFNEEKIVSYINKNKKENIKNYIINKSKQNLGTVKSFNNSIKLSKGNYIFPLACDDCFYDRKAIENIVNYLKNTDLLLATSYRYIYDESLKNKIYREPKEEDIQYFYKDSSELYYKLCKGNFISGASTYYKREFFDRYGDFDEKYVLLEDYPKYLNITRKGCKIGFIDIPTIKYRLGGISTSKKRNLVLEADFNHADKEEILPYIKKIDFKLFLFKLAYYIKTKRNLNLLKEKSMIDDYTLYKKLKLNIKYIDLVFIKAIRNTYLIKKIKT